MIGVTSYQTGEFVGAVFLILIGSLMIRDIRKRRDKRATSMDIETRTSGSPWKRAATWWREGHD